MRFLFLSIPDGMGTLLVRSSVRTLGSTPVEINQKFLPEMEKGGIKVSGTSPDGILIEFVEVLNCKFFVAT